MTLPQFPWGETDPADLPQGVIIPSEAGTALQDQTQGKYTAEMASRFPDIASNTLAGSPSGGGPLGFVTQKASQIVSNIANADPATINGPNDIVARAGGFFGGLPITNLLDVLFSAFNGIGSGPFAGIANFFLGKWGLVDNAKNAADAAAAQAQGALNAAKAADRKVTALLQGGTRTVYTSNTTWTKPTGLVKLGVLLYGGGRKGTDASYSGVGGLPGGLVYAEYVADVLPASVAITIGPGSSSVGTASLTSFGTILDSGQSGGGQLQNSTLIALAASVFPGMGGTSGPAVNDAGGYGLPGGSTYGASGGAANGGAGGNASVTGQALSGGGGGGGGQSSQRIFGAASNGGAGGFPGGGGGAAGRNGNESYWVGGAGAPGLCALIEYTQAAA